MSNATRFYPIGTPGQPWGDAERALWRSRHKRQRSHRDDVVTAVEKLAGAWDVEEYGALEYDGRRYPLLALKSRGWDESLPTMLVTGGVHGYETSGVHGALEFAASHAGDYAGRAAVLQAREDPLGRQAESLNAMQRANVASVLEGPWANDFETAARSLLGARRIGVLGLRASHGVAHHFQYLLDMLRDESLLLTDTAGTLLDHVHRLGEKDSLVVFSQAPYTRVARDVARGAAARGVGIVALTDSPLSPIARSARHVLLARTDSPSYFQSVTGAIALGETLLQTIASLGGRTVLERLRTVQAQREADRAYIDPATATRRYLRSAP